MKTHIRFLALAVLGTITAVIILVLGLRSSVASADGDYPEKASQIATWIDEQSAVFKQQELEVERLNREKEIAESKRNDAHTAASGYRNVLCAEFGLRWESGKFVSVDDAMNPCASFQ
jgi:hypothetical protein